MRFLLSCRVLVGRSRSCSDLAGQAIPIECLPVIGDERHSGTHRPLLESDGRSYIFVTLECILFNVGFC